ncbi:MAG: ABC transporter substrate-binding protein [Candidatus Vecturithrix sp.]|nr:ABC transporter substrate-binding protein [Candidatus Vecturithrix sp.]
MTKGNSFFTRSRLLAGMLTGLIIIALQGMIFAQLPEDVPRSETLIVDQIFRYGTPNNFNLWVPSGTTPTRQGLFVDTLWYIDQQTGEWINALAESAPVYNEDFTEMTVKLRQGILWSDGVEFTADDVVFTIEKQKNTPGMTWSTNLGLDVASVKKTDDYTVVVSLNKSLPRFHSLFTARYNACYIMPKHIWEKVDAPMEFTFYPPVSLGAYVVKDTDPAGYWELYELREDWDKTSSGIVTGKPGPKYILTIFYGPSEKKVMAMTQHQLDLFMDVDYEAFQSLIEKSDTARSWYQDFPWAWPDELDARWFGCNLEKEPYNIKDVRWALALALDIVELQTEYIGGISRVTPLPQPATPFHMKHYHKPLVGWLKEFTIEIGDGETFAPFDETVPAQIVEWARAQGYAISAETQEEMIDMFGVGWWKYAPEVAEKLLMNHGFTRDANDRWLLPDGTPWSFEILAAPDEVDVYRMAMGAVDQWDAFGISVEIRTLERGAYYNANRTGDFTVTSNWGFSGGIGATAALDKWPFITELHSNFYKPLGEVSMYNALRVKSPEVDTLIETLGALPPNDPQVLELGREFLKLWTENMWSIPTISFKKFVTQDLYYWKNFPMAENPYGQPCYWFMGGRFIYPQLEATGKE